MGKMVKRHFRSMIRTDMLMRMLQKNISQMMTAEAMNSCSERTMTRLVIMTTYLSRETERG